MYKCLTCELLTPETPCEHCESADTREVEWVSEVSLWKPWTWFRGHWELDDAHVGPRNWWRRDMVGPDYSVPPEYWILIGSKATGAAAGAGAGLAVGGAPGAVWGAVVGTTMGEVFSGVAEDFYARALGVREKLKIGGAFRSAVLQHRENRSAGLELNPAFVEVPSDGGRPAAAEVLEGVLFAARDEPEEKKLPFLGRLFANIAVEHDLDRGSANAMVRISDRLSFRQMLLLDHCKHLDDQPDPPPELRLGDRGRRASPTWPTDLEADLHEMVNPLSLLNGDLRPTDLGARLWRLMGLGDLPESDREGIRDRVRAIRDEEDSGGPLEGIPPTQGPAEV